MARGARRLNREGWTRKAAWVELSLPEVAALLRPVLGDIPIAGVQPVGGGLVNTNVRVTLSAPPWCVLLRLFRRERQQAIKEAALDRMVGSRVPTARFLYFAETNPVKNGPYAVLQWIDGIQLGHAAWGADDETLEKLGVIVGDVLARIHKFRFDCAGFFASDLTVPAAIDLDRDALLCFMHRCLREGPGGERLGVDLTDRLFAFVRQHGDVLEAWLGDPRLTHADYNPSNILVTRDGMHAEVAAVLDWEFALSATPAFDFGNLLRPPLGDSPAFVSGLARGYQRAGGTLPLDWQFIARIADLFAWADLLGQRSEDGALAADARHVITATIGMRPDA